MAEGRSRISKAERKQLRQIESLDRSWMKYAKCSICRQRFVVNNYPDRKVRLSHHKLGDKIVCPWCRDRDGKYLVQLRLIAEKVAQQEQHIDMACKCLPCVTARILQAHDELPSRR